MNPILKRVLKILAWIVGVLVVLILTLVLYINAAWDNPVNRRVPQMSAPRDSAHIARGEFLYTNSALCWMCHGQNQSPVGPPSGGFVEDLRNLGPGFGLWYIPNITPDEQTGIGSWTDGELVRLLREGIKKDGRPVFIMPSERFHGMSDEDVLSIIAYLRSLQPVNNPVPSHQPSLLAKALFTFGVMKPRPEVMGPVPTPQKGITVEWGKYITEHATPCLDCHSPVDLNTGQFYPDSALTGGNIPFGKKGPGQQVDAPAFAYGPNLTPDPETGIGSWTEEQFLLAVRTGTRPDGRVLTNHMPYAYFGLWPEDDAKAVYQYLMSLKPVRKRVPPVELRPDITATQGVPRGGAIFKTYCQGCHGVAGAGAPPTKLILADLAQTIDDATLKKFIQEGQINLRMPAFNKTLSDEQVNDVIAYIRTLKH